MDRAWICFSPAGRKKSETQTKIIHYQVLPLFSASNIKLFQQPLNAIHFLEISCNMVFVPFRVSPCMCRVSFQNKIRVSFQSVCGCGLLTLLIAWRLENPAESIESISVSPLKWMAPDTDPASSVVQNCIDHVRVSQDNIGLFIRTVFMFNMLTFQYGF